jgi:hypothetical protein
MTRRSYSGNAAPTTLAAGINGSDTTILIAASTGWPTGSSAPFLVVIDRGQATEEKVLIQSRSGTTLTVATSGRGYDSTSAATHSAGASIEHCLGAIDVDEANAHVNDTGRDDHTQYHNTSRHAAVSHLIGTHLPAPAAPAAVNATSSAGSSTSAARADHVHALDAAVAGSGLGLSAGVLAVNVDGTTLEVASDQVRVRDAGITQAKMASGLRVPVVCTSSTRPTGVAGLLIYETDTNLFVVYNGSHWVQITPESAYIQGTGGINSTTFTDLNDEVGPAVTVLTGTKAIVNVHAHVNNNSVQFNIMGFAVSGASTIAASDNYAALYTGSLICGVNGTFIVTNLTPGLNTFTAKYRLGGDTAAFQRRSITVTPLP